MKMIKEKKNQQIFTIVGFWFGTGQRFCDSVLAKNAIIAERKCLIANPGLAGCAIFNAIVTPVDKHEYICLN